VEELVVVAADVIVSLIKRVLAWSDDNTYKCIRNIIIVDQ
jgi:hypothetical protein